MKDVAIDAGKDLVKVTGTMDAAALPGYLRDKLSRAVDVVAPGKKDGGGGDKKDKGDKKDGGEEKKDKSAASAAVAPMPMAEAGMYQMPPHYGYAPYPPAPGGYYGGGGGYAHGGVEVPAVVCQEKGPCYGKKVACPKRCFWSYSRSGNGYGAGGGGGSCAVDCKAKCTATC